MKNALCSAVGFVRKFGGCKTAEVLAFAAKSNLGIPFPSRPVQGDAKQTAGFIADWCSPLVLLIGAVAGSINIPLIVGGGITDPEKAYLNCKAGANMIVVGNAIEKDPGLIKEMSAAIHASGKIIAG